MYSILSHKKIQVVMMTRKRTIAQIRETREVFLEKMASELIFKDKW